MFCLAIDSTMSDRHCVPWHSEKETLPFERVVNELLQDPNLCRNGCVLLYLHFPKPKPAIPATPIRILSCYSISIIANESFPTAPKTALANFKCPFIETSPLFDEKDDGWLLWTTGKKTAHGFTDWVLQGVCPTSAGISKLLSRAGSESQRG